MRCVFSTLLLILTGLVAFAPVASAQEEGPTADPNGDGLRYVGATTFRPDPTRGVVAVTAELDLTNVQPDERTSDGVLEYFFPGVILPVIDSARDLPRAPTAPIWTSRSPKRKGPPMPPK